MEKISKLKGTNMYFFFYYISLSKWKLYNYALLKMKYVVLKH